LILKNLQALELFLQKAAAFLKNKEKFLFFIKGLVALFLLYYLISSIGFHKTYLVFAGADIVFLAAALILMPLNITFQFLKWKQFATNCLGEQNNKVIFYSLISGMASGAVTPGRIGELSGRFLVMSDKNVLDVTAATLIDKMISFFVIVVVGFYAMLAFLGKVYMIPVFLLSALAVLFFSVNIFLFLMIFSDIFWKEWLRTFLKSNKITAPVYDRLQTVKLLNKKILLKNLFYSLLNYAVFISQFALLVAAFSQQVNFFSYWFAGSLMFFTKSLIPGISPGELGVREATSIYYLSYFSVADAAAFNASLSIYLINILFPSLLSFFVLFKKTGNA